MVINDFSVSIAADLQATNPSLADLFLTDPVAATDASAAPIVTPPAPVAPAPGTIIAFLEKILADVMTAFGGCGIPPVAATAMMVGRPGLRGLFDRSSLINIVRNRINGSALQGVLLMPVVASIEAVGKTVTVAHTTTMMSEAGVAA
jgi:hypothetical protein